MGRHAAGFWDKRSERWYVRLTDPATGRKRAIMLRHPDGRHIARGDRGAAAAVVRRLLAERDAATVRATGPTVAEVCRAFVAWHAENGSAQRTVDDHHYHLTRFSKFEHGGVRYMDRPAASIGPEDLWRTRQAGLGSIRLLYASVMACWRWAARPVEGRAPARMIPANPLAGLAKPRAGAPVEKAIPWEDARALLRFARGWARARAATRREHTRVNRRLKVLCLHFIAVTGCRPFEAIQLEWTEVLWKEGFVRILERSKTRRTGKARQIAVPDRMMTALAWVHRQDWSHPRYAFVPAWTRGKGAPRVREWIDWVRLELKPAALAAGVPIPEDFTMYFLRHEYSNIGLEIESAEGISATVGNSPKVLLDRYEATKRRRIREVSEKVAKHRRAKRD